MTLRIPKKGTGSAWSANYWTPEDYPEIPLLLSLTPATRRWLFGVPGAGVGFYWTLPDADDRRKDTDAEWGVGDHNLAFYAASKKFYAGKPLPDDADVDRALWLPESPWAVLEALPGAGFGLRRRAGLPPSAAPYFADCGDSHGSGATAHEAVLRLADQIIGGTP